MPIRIPVQTVIVHRDGKNKAAPIGKPFTFTDQELADIKAVNPRAIRLPLNEVSDTAIDAQDALAKAEAAKAAQAEAEAAAVRDALAKAEAAKAAGKGGKGGKSDDKSDDEAL